MVFIKTLMMVTLFVSCAANTSQAIAMEKKLSDFSELDYISGKEINAANGRYSTQMEGLGTVNLKLVSLSGAAYKRKADMGCCLIDKRALEKQITRGFRSMSGGDAQGERTVEVKMKGEMKNGQMVCSEGGSNCTVHVSKPGCRYDPVSAALLCS